MRAIEGDYKHDAFVSYAHVDNRPLGPYAAEWIEVIVCYLKRRLTTLLKRPADMWHDPQLPGNARLWPELVEHLHGATVFLAVTSPGYLHSTWCLKELSEFVRWNGGDTSARSRIIRVAKHPVDEFLMPRILAQTRSVAFYQSGSGHDAAPLFPSQLAFRSELRRLGSHVGDILTEVNRRGAAARKRAK